MRHIASGRSRGGFAMVRAVAAGTPTRARIAQGLMSQAELTAFPPYSRFEPWVRHAIPAMIVVFIASLVALTVLLVNEAHDRAIEDAMLDLDLIAANVTNDFNAAVDRGEFAATQANAATAALGATGASSADIRQTLAQILPDRAVTRGQRILVSDAQGQIVAAFPASLSQRGRLLDRLGADEALTTFAEKAGVIRVNLADGTDALATVRTLKRPFAQVAFVHPMPAVLADWQRSTLRAGAALLLTIIVLCSVTWAYFWQAARARRVETDSIRIRGRIDAALHRGRCGLWDWDLARGRIYWSDSMYAMLGMVPERSFLSFGDVHALVHPND